MHHGKFTTAREAVEAHHGEAEDSRRKFEQLSPEKQGEVIEFLKSLQVLPPGSKSLVVDEHGNAKDWPSSTGSSEDEQESCATHSKAPYVFANFEWLHLSNSLTAGPAGSFPFAV